MSTILKSNIAQFHDHHLQWVLALFCTKPELYKDHKEYKYRQDYFFKEFQKFAAKYYRFSGEESVYFGSVRKQAAGEANICGGAGRLSGSSSRYFKNRYYNIEKSREKQIDEFAKKYGISFDPIKKDVRLFLGVTEIWNRLDHVIEIVASSKWADVRERAYDDESFATPFPKKLDKELVQFDIRNRVMQKFRAVQCRQNDVSTSRNTENNEDEVVGCCGYETKVSMGMGSIIVIPDGLDDEW
jgi:hypothetical protein